MALDTARRRFVFMGKRIVLPTGVVDVIARRGYFDISYFGSPEPVFLSGYNVFDFTEGPSRVTLVTAAFNSVKEPE